MMLNSKNIFKIFIGIFGIALALWFYSRYKKAPEFPAYDNTVLNAQGTPIKISDFKGKYVLVSYFQTWCGDCIKEMPSIDHLQSRLGKEKLSVVMISDESWAKIDHFKEKYCNTLDFYQSVKTLREQNIHVFPTTYLLNKKGVVILTKLEGYDWSSDEAFHKCVD